MTFAKHVLPIGALILGLGVGTASAAPLSGQGGLAAPVAPLHEVVYRHHHRSVHHHRAWRRHHTRNKMRHGDPNARNPERPGHMQQRGGTSGGPRY